MDFVYFVLAIGALIFLTFSSLAMFFMGYSDYLDAKRRSKNGRV